MEYLGGAYTPAEFGDGGWQRNTIKDRRDRRKAIEAAAILAGDMEAWRARRLLQLKRPRGLKRLDYEEEAAGLAAVDLLIWGVLASSALFLLSSALKRK